MQIRSDVVGSRWLSFKVCFRDQMEEEGGNYFAAADEAAELCQQEEDDCIRLGIQVSCAAWCLAVVYACHQGSKPVTWYLWGTWWP